MPSVTKFEKYDYKIISRSWLGSDGKLYNEDTMEGTGTKTTWVYVKVGGLPSVGPYPTTPQVATPVQQYPSVPPPAYTPPSNEPEFGYRF